jgi:hypothetical protein
MYSTEVSDFDPCFFNTPGKEPAMSFKFVFASDVFMGSIEIMKLLRSDGAQVATLSTVVGASSKGHRDQQEFFLGKTTDCRDAPATLVIILEGDTTKYRDPLWDKTPIELFGATVVSVPLSDKHNIKEVASRLAPYGKFTLPT